MRALVIQEPGRLVVGDLTDPIPRSGEVLVRVQACGVCGTDLHIYEGSYVGDYPVVPGHEFAGVVEAVGEDVTRFRAGDRVAVEPNLPCNNCAACLSNRQNFCEHWRAIGVTMPGAMAELVVVPEQAAFAVGDLEPEVAAFVEPLSCVLHGVRKLTVEPGSRVAVIGAGPIGLLLARTLLALGATRLGFAERNPARRDFAESAGSTIEAVADDASRLEADAWDIVVDATGAAAAMASALSLARPGGQVLWFGVPGSDATIEFEPFQVFRKGLSIHGSFTSVRNSLEAIELLASGRVRVDDLVSHRVALDEVEDAMRMLAGGASDARKIMVIP